MSGGGRCGSCGWELMAGARFCARCGAPVGIAAEPTDRDMVPSGEPGAEVVARAPGRWAIVAVVGVGLLVAV
ncbi:MAG: zinc-ribbon domain-containing protein, partial [Actinomycetota bacterium]